MKRRFILFAAPVVLILAAVASISVASAGTTKHASSAAATAMAAPHQSGQQALARASRTRYGLAQGIPVLFQPFLIRQIFHPRDISLVVVLKEHLVCSPKSGPPEMGVPR